MLWCIKVLIGVNFNVSGVLFTLPPKELHLLTITGLLLYRINLVFSIN
uniref:Uncharacterized protein n=1 Tax=Siphoviridae sp. ctlwB1 TaxID=2826449 RepID=A0A8S5NCH9_9CAUD|nr:MAG TPA: hypothetical protein [Siphoviridae sp. ctlwB1]